MISHPSPQNKMPLFRNMRIDYVNNSSILFKLKKKKKIINSLNLSFLIENYILVEINFIRTVFMICNCC